MKKRLISLILIGLSGLVLAQEASTNRPERLVRYSFTLTNQKGDFIPDAELWVRLPVQQTSGQTFLSYKASYPCELIPGKDGNQTLRFQFKSYPPYARKIVRIEARTLVGSEPAETDIEPSVYLGSAKFMELDSPEFKKLAPHFGNGKPDRIAHTVMNWMKQNVQDAGYLKRDHGALYALTEKKGDCTEQAYLFAALCRVHNIPARVLGGYVTQGNAVLGPLGYHNWVEFYDGNHWQTADPQRGVFAEKGGEYTALCIADDEGPLTDTARFKVKGEGLTAKMN